MTLIYAADLAFFKEIRSKVQLTKIVKKFKVYYGTLFMKKKKQLRKRFYRMRNYTRGNIGLVHNDFYGLWKRNL